MAITPLPTPPSRSMTEPEFVAAADAHLAALPAFVTEANALAVDVNNNAATVSGAASTSVSAAAAATSSAGTAAAAASSAQGFAALAADNADAEEWVSGGSYAAGQAVYSPVTFFTYRSKTAHSGITIDPSDDDTNWVPLTALPIAEKYLLKSAAYTAAAGEKIAADVSGAAWTLSLPASPADGDTVTVGVFSGDPKTNLLTIDGGVPDVQGGNTFGIDAAHIAVDFVYNGTEWKVAI